MNKNTEKKTDFIHHFTVVFPSPRLKTEVFFYKSNSIQFSNNLSGIHFFSTLLAHFFFLLIDTYIEFELQLLKIIGHPMLLQ
jgi:hypothetical protein